MTRLLAVLLLLSTPAMADVQVEFSPGYATEAVVGVINRAERSIHLAAYGFSSRPIAAALIAASRRGVQVAVVLDRSNETQRYSEAGEVARNGIPVRIDAQYPIMHSKFLIIDGKTVETGSLNYTAASKRNGENVLILRDDPVTAGVYEREWERLWGESREYGAGEAP